MKVTKKQLQDKVFELNKERNKYLDALNFMASQLTNPDYPPSVKIAMALEEYIGAVQSVKIVEEE